MRYRVFCLLTVSWALGCSLTVRNPQACLFEGPPVCREGFSCDPMLNQCVPNTDGGAGASDLQCSGYFCNDSPAILAASQVERIWGTSASDIWAIQYPNSIFHWDGQSWSQSKAASGPALHGLTGLNATNIWAVGDNGTVYRGDGVNWTLQAAPSATSLYGVWVQSAGQVWVAGYLGLIYKGDGDIWAQSLSDSTYGNFLALSGVDAQNIFAVSNVGRIATWNGAMWSMTSVTTATLLSVSAQAANNVWAVGVSSRAYRFDGTTWTPTNLNGTVDNDVTMEYALVFSKNIPSVGIFKQVGADNLAAIIIEPVQGEGGARALSEQDLRKMRQLCDDNGVLLIYDEIQCGLGRTGKLFAFEHGGIVPDIVTMAKGLTSSYFPLGVVAMLVTGPVCSPDSTRREDSSSSGSAGKSAAGAARPSAPRPSMSPRAARTIQLRRRAETGRATPAPPRSALCRAAVPWLHVGSITPWSPGSP